MKYTIKTTEGKEITFTLEEISHSGETNYVIQDESVTVSKEESATFSKWLKGINVFIFNDEGDVINTNAYLAINDKSKVYSTTDVEILQNWIKSVVEQDIVEGKALLSPEQLEKAQELEKERAELPTPTGNAELAEKERDVRIKYRSLGYNLDMLLDTPNREWQNTIIKKALQINRAK